jgi:putative DNA primase/helicase
MVREKNEDKLQDLLKTITKTHTRILAGSNGLLEVFGKICYNTFVNKDQGYLIYETFLMDLQIDEELLEKLEQYYLTLEPTNYTITTARYLVLREDLRDDPSDEMPKRSWLGHLKKGLSDLPEKASDDDIAEIIEEYYGYRIVSGDGTIYEFDGNKLVDVSKSFIYRVTKEMSDYVVEIIDENYDSIDALDTEISDLISKAILKDAEKEKPTKKRGRPKKAEIRSNNPDKHLRKNRVDWVITESDNDETVKLKHQANELTQKNRMLEKLRIQLGNSTNKKGIYECYVETFGKHGLKGELNTNPYILPILNGNSVCMDGDKLKIRISLPEDMMTKTARFRYYKTPPPYYKEFTKWMEEIFPEEDVRVYIFMLMAYLMLGGNPEKLMFILSGNRGNNSKTTFITFIAKALGDFANSISPTTFSGKTDGSDKADGSMALAVTSRMAYMEETDANMSINSSKIKSTVTEGNKRVRTVFKDGISAEIMCKLFMVVNLTPHFDNPDEATRKRVVIIPFTTMYESKYEEEEICDLDDQEKCEAGINTNKVLKIDPNFKNKYEKPFMDCIGYVMVNYFDIWKNTGLSVYPKKIRDALDEYWGNSDPYQSFVNERLNISHKKNRENLKIKVTVTEIYAEFLSFIRSRGNVTDIPKLEVVIHSLSVCINRRPHGGKFSYVSFR